MRTVRGVCRVDLRGQIRLRLRCRTCGLPWPHGSGSAIRTPRAGVRPYELVGRASSIDGFDVALQRSGLRLAARSKILYGLRGLADRPAPGVRGARPPPQVACHRNGGAHRAVADVRAGGPDLPGTARCGSNVVR